MNKSFFYRGLVSKYILIALLSSISIYSYSQLVNIESKRLQSDTLGWLGSAKADLTISSNGQTFTYLNSEAQIEYKAKKDLYLFLLNYQLAEANLSDLQNAAFAHFRYNRKLGRVIRWEAFTQVQSNAVTKIDLRFLLGMGSRFKLTDKDAFKLYAGIAYMFEYEEVQDSLNPFQRNQRNSDYISMTISPSDDFSFISTTYYQPLFNYLNDFRILNQEVLKFTVSKHFNVTPKFSYLYDAFPAPEVPQNIFYFSTGIEFEF